MDGEQQSREALEAEAKLRFAWTLVTHVIWPLLKGVAYGLGGIGMLLGLSNLFRGS